MHPITMTPTDAADLTALLTSLREWIQAEEQQHLQCFTALLTATDHGEPPF